MAQTGVTIEVSAPPTLPGGGGLVDTLRRVGLVVEYVNADDPTAPDVDGLSAEQRAGSAPVGDGRWWETRDSVAAVARSQSRPVGCGDLVDWVDCGHGGDYTSKATSEQPSTTTQEGWDVVADDACSTFSVRYEERVDRAVTNLVRKQSNSVAAELWRGTLAQEQSWDSLYLAGAAVQVTAPGSPLPLSYALGALQEALGGCLGDGQAGIIHASRTTVTAWLRDGTVLWDSDRGVLVDVFGNVVVASGAYDGSDPDGVTTDGVPWVYATGPVVVRLGPVRLISPAADWLGSVERQNNDLTVRAERTVNYQFDGCCVFAAAVDICNACCEPGGS